MVPVPSAARTRTRLAILVVGVALAALLLHDFFQKVSQGRERARAIRSMMAIRAAGVALEAYAAEHGGLFPPAVERDATRQRLDLPRFEWGETCAWPSGATSALSEVASLLERAYIEELPRDDAWGNPILYATSPDLRSYTIVSAGGNGTLEPFQRHTWSHGGDVVYSDGTFRSYLEGRCV
jgi:type II secretory pathway pseudopilin PulG